MYSEDSTAAETHSQVSFPGLYVFVLIMLGTKRIKLDLTKITR